MESAQQKQSRGNNTHAHQSYDKDRNAAQVGRFAAIETAVRKIETRSTHKNERC